MQMKPLRKSIARKLAKEGYYVNSVWKMRRSNRNVIDCYSHATVPTRSLEIITRILSMKWEKLRSAFLQNVAFISISYWRASRSNISILSEIAQ